MAAVVKQGAYKSFITWQRCNEGHLCSRQQAVLGLGLAIGVRMLALAIALIAVHLHVDTCARHHINFEVTIAFQAYELQR